MIWAQDSNGAIGYKNNLLFPLPEDLKYFAQQTKNSVVVMGRLTWDSLPDKNKPLPNRTNIVLTRSSVKFDDDVEIYSNFQSVKEKYNKDTVWIIGGSQIYKSLLSFADELYVTQIYEKAKNADVFAPSQENIDKLFKLSEQSNMMTSAYKNIPFQFKIFERI